MIFFKNIKIMNYHKLQDYLNSIDLRGLKSDHIKIVELKAYEKQGFSNKIFLIKVETSTGFHKELILRVYPSNGKKALREFKILSILYDMGIPVPEVYAIDKNGEVLGKPFIIMERIRQSSTANIYEFIDAAAKSLVSVHNVTPIEIEGIIEIKNNYPLNELRGIKALLTLSMLTSLRNHIFFAELFRCAENLGKNHFKARLRLIHGDYGFDNIIYSGGKAYIVDWESAGIAEPTFDVAYAFNFLDFDDRISGRTGQKLSEAFINSYEKYGGSIMYFEFYRKLAAIKILAILEAVSQPGLMGFLSKEFRRRTENEDIKRFLEMFKRYLREILSLKNY